MEKCGLCGMEARWQRGGNLMNTAKFPRRFDMPDHNNTTYNEISLESQGSILRGILGSAIGMVVCVLVMLLCALCRMGSFSTMLQLFEGLVIGGFYRLFHGRRSKISAYVTVGICTVSASILWVVLLAVGKDLGAAAFVRRFGVVWVFLYQKKPAGICGLEKRTLVYRICRGEWVFLQPASGKTSCCQPSGILCRT